MTDRFSPSIDPISAKPEINRSEYVPDIEIDPIEFGRSLLRHRRLIIRTTAAAMILTAAVMLLTPNQYTSSASILPSGNENRLSGLMDLAGSFGLSSSGGLAAENSSALYPSILLSNHVVDGVLTGEYQKITSEGWAQLRLSEYFDRRDANELRADLRRLTAISTDKKLGIVKISVETKHPHLSQAVLSSYIEELEEFLTVKRRTQARANVAYLADQIALQEVELVTAEEVLREFMSVNRNWNSSSDPDLQTDLARLQRDVAIEATTVHLLKEQLELASLEAQKSIPIVRILDEPSLPTIKSGPHRTASTLFVGILVFSILLTGMFLRHLWQRSLSAGDERINVLREEVCDAFPRSSRLLRLTRPAEAVSRDEREGVTV